MKRDRLELALQRLKAGDWKRFEEFASEVLAGEYSGLRSLASTSGDGGSDATLYVSDSDRSVAIQFSVREKWRDKITETAKRLGQTTPSVSLLIYCTSQQIGALADSLKKDLRQKYNLHLDIRDCSWYLDRSSEDVVEVPGERLAEIYVDPLLRKAGKEARKAHALDNEELAAAHMFLALQWADQSRDRGLTKSCFDALVLSSLRKSSPSERVSKKEITDAILSALPESDPKWVEQQVESAIARMVKDSIRSYADKSYCLSDQQRQKARDFEQKQMASAKAVEDELRSVAARCIPSNYAQKLGADDLASRGHEIIEKYMYARGEEFAAVVVQRKNAAAAQDLIERLVHESQAKNPPPRAVAHLLPGILKEIVKEVLSNPPDSVQAFLRTQADAYTLAAFLRLAPDVQRATKKMFSHGEIWVDTSIILFLAAESLQDDAGPVTRVITAARSAGISLLLSEGFLEEVERHMNLCVSYSRSGLIGWVHGIPYLAHCFIMSGRPKGAIPDWLDRFRGRNRPLDDIKEWVAEEYGIQVRSLEDDAQRVRQDVRNAVIGEWQDAHEKRRTRRGQDVDAMTVNRLARHDADCYLAVIHRRNEQSDSGLGYTSWWLTTDKFALGLSEKMWRNSSIKEPTPVMSLDFLANYLSFGPNRASISREVESKLPILIEPSMVRFLTPQLLEEADKVRSEASELPERIRRRKVRDFLDEARRTQGEIGAAIMEPQKVDPE